MEEVRTVRRLEKDRTTQKHKRVTRNTVGPQEHVGSVTLLVFQLVNVIFVKPAKNFFNLI